MENMNNESIKHLIIEKIKEGEANMRPRWHFILRTVLGIIGIIILILTSIYLVSFVIFAISSSGILTVSSFGFRGLKLFVLSLPWFIILAVLVFMVLLEFLVKKYAFSYKKPLLFSLIAVLILVVVGNFVVFRIGLHEKFFNYANRDGLPIMGGMYLSYVNHDLGSIHSGQVIGYSTSTIIIQDGAGRILSILVKPETYFPMGSTSVGLGDYVMIMEDSDSKTDDIKAFGIRKISRNFIQMRMAFPPLPPR